MVKKLFDYETVGLFLLFVCHVVFFTIFKQDPLALGLVQLIYVTPLAWFLHKKQYKALMRGVLMGAGLTLLINSICYGLSMSQN